MFGCCKKITENKVTPKEIRQVIMLGLDSAGKSALFNRMKHGTMSETTATIGFRCDSFVFNDYQFEVWECGGSPKFRRLWWHQYDVSQALIYVVDSSDRTRLKESKKELDNILKHEDFPKDIPVLIFLTKMDLYDTLTTEDIIKEFKLKEWKNRRWHIQEVSPNEPEDFAPGLNWLTSEFEMKKSEI